MFKLMIVEDDLNIARAIKEQATGWGLDVLIVENFRNVIDDFLKFKPHIVFLDIKLPFYDGYYWCSEIRKLSNVPIIFLSSASDNMNIIMAINMGADDFISKPFDMSVLIAKTQALLRRSYSFSEGSNLIEHRGAILNLDDDSLDYNGEKISLTKNEFRILFLLMQNKGKIVTREKIMEYLWKTELFIDDNTLTVNINRLRKKLKAAGLNEFILTKHGVGYYIEDN